MRVDDDFDLVKQALCGEESAFAILAERHYPRTYRVCYGVLGNVQDAEDCVQETWIKVFGSLASFGGRASFTTWLYRIAMNACYDYIRRHRRVPTEPLDGEAGRACLWPARQVASEEPLPDEWVVQQEFVTIVRAHILRLPPKYARVLWLRDIEGLCYAQIAAIEKIREGTVKSRLFRARAQLGQQLADKELF